MVIDVFLSASRASYLEPSLFHAMESWDDLPCLADEEPGGTPTTPVKKHTIVVPLSSVKTQNRKVADKDLTKIWKGCKDTYCTLFPMAGREVQNQNPDNAHVQVWKEKTWVAYDGKGFGCIACRESAKTSRQPK
jgi:hypothetical protein